MTFWHFAKNNEPYWTYVFSGKRNKVGCKSCRAKRLRW